MEKKINLLFEYLRDLNSIAVAFSGGTDSTFLLAAAKRVLDKKVIAVAACSPSFPAWERADVANLAQLLESEYLLLDSNEFEAAEFTANTSNRCYFCKRSRFRVLCDWAQNNGYAWVVEGTQADDGLEWRPGMQAIAEMAKVKSPLLDIGFTKQEIRSISRAWRLPTWDKPSSACLVSRLAYGIPITKEVVSQVEQAEQLIKGFTGKQFRVRHHGKLARIEVPCDDFRVFIREQVAKTITEELKKLGFTYVTLDLAGYRVGSMDEVLERN